MTGNIINLQFQIVAYIIIVFIIYMYVSKERLELERERIFKYLLSFGSISIVLDFLAILLIHSANQKGIFEQLENFTRRLYLLSIVFFIYNLMLDALNEIYGIQVYKKVWRYFLTIPMMASIPLIGYLMAVRDDNNPTKFSGAVYTSMFTTVVYLLITLIFVISNCKTMKMNRVRTLILCCSVFFACGFVQLQLQQYRLMSIGISIILLILFLELDTPEMRRNAAIGLFNEHALNLYLDNRIGTSKNLSIVMILFKDLEYLGSYAGEKNLIELVRLIAEFLKADKCCSRLFVIRGFSMVAVCEDEAYYTDYLNQIRKRAEQSWSLNKNGNEIEYEIKMAIVAYPKVLSPMAMTGRDVIDTLNSYGNLLIQSRDQDFICIDNRELHENESVNQMWLNIHSATQTERIDVLYQPVYSVKENRYTELEALVRISDDRGVFFDQNAIWSIAEFSGEIVSIGYEVFKKVCMFVADKQPSAYGIKKIRLSLSATQLQQSDLSTSFLKIMDENKVTASSFIFEVAEKAAIHMSHNFQRNINTLVEAGARFVIGDYGENGINPDIALMLDVQNIRVSQKVVEEYFNSSRKQYLSSLCKMLSDHRMSVLVGEVRNQNQYSELKKLGVLYIQGSAFYRPMEGDRIIEMLENENATFLGQEVMYERML